MNKTGIIQNLQTKGLKLNKSRMQILDLFIGNHKSYSAPELVELLKNNMDRATVYRNLSFLVENGFLEQLFVQDEPSIYELSSLDHHHHLICKKCKKLFPLHSKTLEKSLTKIMSEVSDFTITEHFFEFYGICKSCNNDEH